MNGKRVRIPVSIDKAGAKVITSGTYALLDTNFGLQVKFDGVHHLEITVPGEYFDKVRRRNPVLLLLHQISDYDYSSSNRQKVPSSILNSGLISFCWIVNAGRLNVKCNNTVF